jgi:hypothetical protein
VNQWLRGQSGAGRPQDSRSEARKSRNAPAAAAAGRAVQIADADIFAVNVRPIVDAVRATGVTELRGIAQALNARGVRSGILDLAGD